MLSRSRKLIKDSRALALGAATGLSLLAWQLPGFAVDFPVAPHRKIASVPNGSAARQLGSGIKLTQFTESDPATSRVMSLYGGGNAQTATAPERSTSQTTTPPQRLPQSQAQPIQAPSVRFPQVAATPPVETAPESQVPVAQTAGTKSKRSLFSRLLGKETTSRRIPAGPPEDPGMRYVTVSQAKRMREAGINIAKQDEKETFAPPPVPGVLDDSVQPRPIDVPKLNPPVSARSISDANSGSLEKPRLFPSTQAPVSAAPQTSSASPAATIPAQPADLVKNDSFIPPPPGMEAIGLPSEAAVDSQLATREPLQKFPELLEIMESPGDTEAVDAPKTAAVDSAASEPDKPKDFDAALKAAREQVEAQNRRLASASTATTVKSRKGSLPVLDLSSPLPQIEEVLAAEKKQANQNAIQETKPQTASTGSSSILPPAIATTDVPPIDELELSDAPDMPAPEFPAPLQGEPVDDFANPFPADGDLAESQEAPAFGDELLLESPITSEDKVATNPVPEPEVDQIEEPYSGLSLEENLFLTTQEPQAEDRLSVVENDAASADLPPLPLPEVDEFPAEKPGFATLDSPPLPDLPVAESELGELAMNANSLQPSPELPHLQAPELAQRPALSARPAPSAPQLPSPAANESKQSKMERIAARKNLTGLKGFCPVALRDERDLLDAQNAFSAIYNGRKYSFSSQSAMERFLAEPEKYAPAAGGVDVIHFNLTGEEVEGSLDHAVWYKGRLYLFTSVETMETFVAAPASHAATL